MRRKLNSISFVILAGIAFWLMPGAANAQKPAVTPAPAKPQNQSIVNTSKSNTKDYSVAPSETGADKGWDGKVQGRQVITPVEIKFESAADFDNFAAGKLPVNFILKNPASGQTVMLASRLVSQGFKPSEDKSAVMVFIVLDNLTAPVWDAAGCVDTKTSAENAAGGEGINITLSYAACSPAGAQNRPGAPLKGVDVKLGRNEAQNRPGNPIPNIIVKGGKNPGGNLLVAPGASEVTENSAEYFKLKMNPSSNGVKRTANIIIVSSGRGSGSPKQAGF